MQNKKYKSKTRKYLFFTFVFFIFGFLFLVFPTVSRAETPEDVNSLIEIRQEQIQEIEQQIAEYWKSVDVKKAKGTLVQNEVETLKDKIAKSELEIRGLRLAIEESEYKLKQTETKIDDVAEHAEIIKSRVRGSLRLINQREEIPILLRLADADKLSAVFVALSELEQLHNSLRAVLNDLKDTKTNLEDVRDAIAQEKNSQERLRRIEESQKEIIARQKAKQTKMFNQIKQEENKLIEKIIVKKQDLSKIKEQITYLTKVGVSAEEAVRFGKLAAIRTGTRTAFLIAVLEVESRLGLNVGKGNWRDDMHARDREAFKSITAKLGLNPDTTPVSKAPSYGWGGAMGPAQFLPNTWLAYEAKVAQLTGHNPPSPWDIEDAFTAAALMLARRGADEGTRDGERRAAKAYISGSPNCSKSICNYYANLVLDKAEEIEQELQ